MISKTVIQARLFVLSCSGNFVSGIIIIPDRHQSLLSTRGRFGVFGIGFRFSAINLAANRVIEDLA